VFSVKATLFTNGEFYTGIHAVKKRDSLLAFAERILFVGPKDLAQEAVPRGVDLEVIDLEGKTIVPGFIDSHLHLLSFGLGMRNVSLSSVRSIDELKRILKERAEKSGDDEWILGRGWDQDAFIERRYPTRKDLDEAVGPKPCFLTRACGHVAVLSSRALEIAGITRLSADPPGGVIDRDPYGEPTGVLRESAMGLVHSKVPRPGPETLEACLKDAAQYVLSKGITSVHTNDGQAGFQGTMELYRKVHNAGIPLRVYWDLPSGFMEDLLETSLRTGSGDDYFRIGAVKLFADGSLGGRTAALLEPYSDDPSTSGILVISEEELKERVYLAHASGMQVAIHAIGDRAVKVSLAAVSDAQSRLPRTPLRPRLVHTQILSPHLITEMKRVGVVADIQPKFISTDMRWAQERVGFQRMRSSYAWKTMLRAGVPLAGGSDCPVEPPDPLFGVYCAVTRKDMDGNPEGGFSPNERVSVEDAIRIFTSGGAYAAFEEQDKGTLEPGKLSDFVVLSEDPYRVEPDRLKDIEVLMTVVGGKMAYKKT